MHEDPFHVQNENFMSVFQWSTGYWFAVAIIAGLLRRQTSNFCQGFAVLLPIDTAPYPRRSEATFCRL